MTLTDWLVIAVLGLLVWDSQIQASHFRAIAREIQELREALKK